MNKWISVECGNLPPSTSREQAYKKYIVRVVFENGIYEAGSYHTTTFVTTAIYNDDQKIWHLDDDICLNALCDVNGSPFGEEYITHWMPLPELPTESSLEA